MYLRHYDNTYKDYTYNDFTYNINKSEITYMFLFTVICKVICKYKQLLVMSPALSVKCIVIISKVIISFMTVLF